MNYNTQKTTRTQRKLAASYVAGEMTMTELAGKLRTMNRLSSASIVARAMRDLARENPSFAQLLKTLVKPGV